MKWLIYAVVAGLIFSSAAFMWHVRVAEPYREEGRAEVRQELQPQLDNLQASLETTRANVKAKQSELEQAQADLGKLRQALEESNARYTALETEQTARQAASAAALAKARDNLARQSSRIAELTAIANAPRSNDETQTCNDARGILRDLARDRLR